MKLRQILALGLFLATSAHAELIQGTYRVPVQSEALEPYATYAVSYETDYRDSAPNELRFPLPDALTGDGYSTYAMRAVPGEPGRFAGPQVEGTCAIVECHLECNVRFKNLQIDPARVDASVRARFSDPGEIAGRLAVALSFASEPIGVLTYPLTEKLLFKITSNHIIFPQK